MTSGARETGKATVSDWARACGGAWQKTEKKIEAETPNPKALLAALSIHSRHCIFTFFSSSIDDTDTDTFLCRVHVGNHNLRGNAATEMGFATLPGIAALMSKLWQRFFIFLFSLFSFCCWMVPSERKAYYLLVVVTSDGCCVLVTAKSNVMFIIFNIRIYNMCVVELETWVWDSTWIFFGCGCAWFSDSVCSRVLS